MLQTQLPAAVVPNSRNNSAIFSATPSRDSRRKSTIVTGALVHNNSRSNSTIFSETPATNLFPVALGHMEQSPGHMGKSPGHIEKRESL